ncbi:MAG: polysaccharide deacetylase family protein [Bacteroidota bacterium]
MFNYQWSRVIFGLALLVAVVGGQTIGVLAIIVVFIGVLSVGSYRIESNFYLPSVNQVNTDKKSIVLSFDDGPTPAITPVILDVLKEFNCEAIFFCIGNKIKGNEGLLQRMVAEGHIVANHSFSHSYWFDFYSSGRVYDELKQTNEEIYRAIGRRSKLFRPPYGVTNPMIARALKKARLSSIGWNKRSLDTVIKDHQTVLNRISKQMQPGDIILMHDSISRSPAILKEFLQNISQTAYKVERLDKLIDIECYEK